MKVWRRSISGRERILRRRRAMTVFELTIVLLILMIIVGVGWVMTRPAVMQTRLSRVMEDHRTMARAISNYQIDFSERPVSLAALSNTANYLGSLPLDPFQNRRGGYVYIPSLSPEMPALLVSAGPDGVFDIPPELLQFADLSLASPGMFPTAPSTAMMGVGRSSSAAMSEEATLAVISAYLYLGTYTPERGGGGDVITVVH